MKTSVSLALSSLINTYMSLRRLIVAGLLTWKSLVTLKKTVLFSLSGNSSPYCIVRDKNEYLVKKEDNLVEEVNTLSDTQVLLIEDLRLMNKSRFVEVSVSIVVLCLALMRDPYQTSRHLGCS